METGKQPFAPLIEKKSRSREIVPKNKVYIYHLIIDRKTNN